VVAGGTFCVIEALVSVPNFLANRSLTSDLRPVEDVMLISSANCTPFDNHPKSEQGFFGFGAGLFEALKFLIHPKLNASFVAKTCLNEFLIWSLWYA